MPPPPPPRAPERPAPRGEGDPAENEPEKDEAAELPDLIRTDRPEPPTWRKALYLGGAVLCFAAGIVGWVVPVVTGLPFWVAGFVLLALSSRAAVRVLNAGERRLPERWRRALRKGISKVPSKRVREAVRQPRAAA